MSERRPPEVTAPRVSPLRPATDPRPAGPGSFVPRPLPGQTRRRDAPDAGGAGEFDRPSSARVCDLLLGGSTHGAVDRRLAAAMERFEPRVGSMARAARAFLRRAVRHLLDEGIDQFVDLGSGVPTMGNVHEVVARAGGGASVAYVERDATAVSSGRRLLRDHPRAVYVDADLRDVDAVLDHPELRRVIDFSRPVGLLAFSVLQQIDDADDPAGIVEDYLSRFVPGSALALSHVTAEGGSPVGAELVGLTRDYAFSRVRPRGRAEVAQMLRGVDLVEPGLTFASTWRPDLRRSGRPVDDCGHLAGVGFRR